MLSCESCTCVPSFFNKKEKKIKNKQEFLSGRVNQWQLKCDKCNQTCSDMFRSVPKRTALFCYPGIWFISSSRATAGLQRADPSYWADNWLSAALHKIAAWHWRWGKRTAWYTAIPALSGRHSFPQLFLLPMIPLHSDEDHLSPQQLLLRAVTAFSAAHSFLSPGIKCATLWLWLFTYHLNPHHLVRSQPACVEC